MREIRTREKITEKTAKERELDRLYGELVDCRWGSDRWNELQKQITELKGEI